VTSVSSCAMRSLRTSGQIQWPLRLATSRHRSARHGGIDSSSAGGFTAQQACLPLAFARRTCEASAQPQSIAVKRDLLRHQQPIASACGKDGRPSRSAVVSPCCSHGVHLEVLIHEQSEARHASSVVASSQTDRKLTSRYHAPGCSYDARRMKTTEGARRRMETRTCLLTLR
jgi:hypothetical protein